MKIINRKQYRAITSEIPDLTSVDTINGVATTKTYDGQIIALAVYHTKDLLSGQQAATYYAAETTVT